MANTQLVFNSTPANFRSTFGSDVVTGDVYQIADAIAQLAEDVFGDRERMLLRDRVGNGWPDDGGFRYVISEIGDDGVERWVTGVRNGELDQRVLTKLREMLSVPFDKRFSAAEAEEARRDSARENEELDKMVEEIGLPMLRDLERCGFIQRPTSYNKRGTMGPRRGVGR